MKISEIITDKYKLRIPPTVYYDLLADVVEAEEEQEPSREFEDYENEIEDLHNRLDIAEYDKERLREEVTNLEAKIQALEQEPCEMTAEEYRQRMIQAFHNADTDGLIAVCVLPAEKEFEHLEWLLKNHYKKEPCEDAISRDAVLEKAGYTETEEGWCGYTVDVDYIKSLPPVNPQPICEEREKGECPYYAG